MGQGAPFRTPLSTTALPTALRGLVDPAPEGVHGGKRQVLNRVVCWLNLLPQVHDLSLERVLAPEDVPIAVYRTTSRDWERIGAWRTRFGRELSFSLSS